MLYKDLIDKILGARSQYLPAEPWDRARADARPSTVRFFDSCASTLGTLLLHNSHNLTGPPLAGSLTVSPRSVPLAIGPDAARSLALSQDIETIDQDVAMAGMFLLLVRIFPNRS